MITGNTRVVAIIADPITHVRTPQAFNTLMAERGADAVMVPFHVKPEDFEAFISHVSLIQSLCGLVITIPYKEAVVSCCTGLTDAVKRIGAANIVRIDSAQVAGQREKIGHNLDGEGFVGGLVRQGYRFDGKRVYLAGAGGAAKAIAHALAEHGVASIGIYNRNSVRAEQLIAQLQACYPHIDAHLATARPDNYTLAVNSTSLGLGEQDAIPFDIDALAAGTVVAEVVMKIRVTPLLARAQQRGLNIHFGHHMMDAQIERMGIFLGLL